MNEGQGDLTSAVTKLADAVDELNRLIAGMMEDLKAQASELSRLGDDIRYLAEEHGALQELVARLIESAGEQRTSPFESLATGPGTPFRAGTPGLEESVPPAGRVLGGPAAPGSNLEVRPWHPEDLRGARRTGE